MLVCGLMGGLRAVAYNDVFQGNILLIGCVVFFIVEEANLGGLAGVKVFFFFSLFFSSSRRRILGGLPASGFKPSCLNPRPQGLDLAAGWRRSN